jgi:hypothetical protein
MQVNPLALLLTIIPYGEPVAERVDVIEINALYDETGRKVFDQDIFWDWCPCRERHAVVAWRLVKHPSQLPERDWERGGWSMLWQDGEVVRLVRAKSVRRTYLQFDPEIEDRKILSKEKRRGLTPARAQ